MKQFFSLKLLLACIMLAAQVTGLRASSMLDALSEVAIIAEANNHKTRSLHDLCRMLKRNMKPDSQLVEAAFDEAVETLVQHKNSLAPEDLERIADSLEEHYDALTEGAETRSTKRFSNVVVH